MNKKIVIVFIILALGGCASLPTRTDTSSEEYLWPKPPATPKIKWLGEWSNRKDFGGSTEVISFLIGEEKTEHLRRPNGIVADLAGNIYVADSEQRLVFVFDLEKETLRFLGFGTLAGPVGLAIDNKRGIIFVSDSRLKKIQGYSKDEDRIVMTIGVPGDFESPSGMVYDDEKDVLYVADTRNHTVKVFDKEGKLIKTMGKHGNGPGEFNFPSYLAIDKMGKLFVVDSFNFRVQIFDAEGNFISAFGKLGDASGFFSRPMGIGVDSEGHIYVIDASFSNFQIFNEDGKLLLWVGYPGIKPGQFYLPSGLYIDKQDRIYVSDTFNRRLQVFQYLRERENST